MKMSLWKKLVILFSLCAPVCEGYGCKWIKKDTEICRINDLPPSVAPYCYKRDRKVDEVDCSDVLKNSPGRSGNTINCGRRECIVKWKDYTDSDYYGKDNDLPINDRCGIKKVEKISPQEKDSGDYFRVRDEKYKIKYKAKDKVGNSDTCQKEFKVEVDRWHCPSELENGAVIENIPSNCGDACHITPEDTCTLTCLPGYHLNPTVGNFATSIEISSIEHAAVSSYRCENFPPEFISCNEGVRLDPEEGTNVAYIPYDPHPQASDVLNDVTISRYGPAVGSPVYEGQTVEVTYVATDEGGLSVECIQEYRIRE